MLTHGYIATRSNHMVLQKIIHRIVGLLCNTSLSMTFPILLCYYELIAIIDCLLKRLDKKNELSSHTLYQHVKGSSLGVSNFDASQFSKKCTISIPPCQMLYIEW